MGQTPQERDTGMFLTIISLVVITLLLYAILRLIDRFWTWLGRGKRLHNAVSKGKLSAEAAAAVVRSDQARATRRLEAHSAGDHPRLAATQISEFFEVQRVEREAFLDNMHLGWYQLVIIFTIASILGLFIEEIWMYVTAGLTQSRVGLVWGPFSPIYGAGAVILTIITYALRKKHAKWWVVFLVSMAVGGFLEQFAGWTMQTVFHMYSWDYSGWSTHITQWVAWPFLFFWGLMGVIWWHPIMPHLLYRIGEPTTQRQAIFIILLTVYLASDIFMTFACFTRSTARDAGEPPQNAFEEWIDENYSDQWIADRFQNLVIEKTSN